jgi:hypothetical protein
LLPPASDWSMPPPVRHQETKSFVKEGIPMQVVPVLDLFDDQAANRLGFACMERSRTRCASTACFMTPI